MVIFIIFGIAFIISALWAGGIDYAEAEEKKHKCKNESNSDFWGEFP